MNSSRHHQFEDFCNYYGIKILDCYTTQSVDPYQLSQPYHNYTNTSLHFSSEECYNLKASARSMDVIARVMLDEIRQKEVRERCAAVNEAYHQYLTLYRLARGR